ncbi:hypothetical protein JW872_00220 [Candidatus Babeliales bacterium]|nr:hypothetical protein [Candidatus Babeliales bacterium]
MYLRMLLYLGILASISSCGSQKKTVVIRDVTVQEAKLSDVPVLIDALVGASRLNDPILDTHELSYTSKLPYQDVVEFYQSEMERAGWLELGSFVGDQALLVFDKPYTLCVVTIQRLRTKVAIHIISGTKKA